MKMPLTPNSINSLDPILEAKSLETLDSQIKSGNHEAVTNLMTELNSLQARGNNQDFFDAVNRQFKTDHLPNLSISKNANERNVSFIDKDRSHSISAGSADQRVGGFVAEDNTKLSYLPLSPDVTPQKSGTQSKIDQLERRMDSRSEADAHSA